MTEHIQVTVTDGVMRVQFARLEKRNALTFAMYGALADALERADADDTVRVVYLTGARGCFTAGNDLNDFMNVGEGLSRVVRFLGGIAKTETPIVAGVSGTAVGIGVTMLLHCDLVYAAASATFRTPFVDLGLVPEAASSLIMPAAMGHQRAAELLMLGETLSAAQAREYGIVNAVFEDDALEAEALARATRLAERAPAALRATKRLMKRAPEAAIREAMAAEAEVFRERLTSPELFEAVQAFMARRKPKFA